MRAGSELVNIAKGWTAIRTLCISMLVHSCEIRKVCNEEEVVEELYRASFRVLFVDDDVSAACSTVSGQCSRIIRTVKCACVGIGLFCIRRVARYCFEDIFVDRVREERQISPPFSMSCVSTPMTVGSLPP